MSDLQTVEDFKQRAIEVINYICEYFNKYKHLRVFPKDDFTVGSLREKLASMLQETLVIKLFGRPD